MLNRSESVFISSLNAYAEDNGPVFQQFRERMKEADSSHIYSRIFNGFSHAGNKDTDKPSLMDKAAFDELCRTYLEILVNTHVKDIQQIEDIKSEDTGGDKIFIIKNPVPRDKLREWAEKIVDLAIRELLDVRGRLKSEFVEIYLGKHPNSLEVDVFNKPEKVRMIVSSFVQAAVEDITVSAVLSQPDLNKYTLQYLAINDIVNRSSPLTIQNKIDEIAKPSGSELGAKFVAEFMKIKSPTLGALASLVVKDLDQMLRKNNLNWYKTKIEFWLDVMWYAAIEKNQPCYEAIHEALAGIEGIGYDVNKEKFRKCNEVATLVFAAANPHEEVDLTGQEDKEQDAMLEKFLIMRDKVFIINSIIADKKADFRMRMEFETQVITVLEKIRDADQVTTMADLRRILDETHRSCLRGEGVILKSSLTSYIKNYIKQIEDMQLAAFRQPRKFSAASSTATGSMSSSNSMSSSASSPSFFRSESVTDDENNNLNENNSQEYKP